MTDGGGRAGRMKAAPGRPVTWPVRPATVLDAGKPRLFTRAFPPVRLEPYQEGPRSTVLIDSR